MKSNYSYIVIEGNIGAGKTSLASMIASDFNARLITERFADNPFLPKFYNDPEKYSFPLELSFLAERYRQLREELTSPDLFSAFSVSDYYFMKSLIFASSTLGGDEYGLYRQIFDIIYTSVPRPDLYVYLHAETGKLLENIGKRGREYEKSITAGYLKSIQEGYFSFFRQNPDMKYLVLDINNIDFVNSRRDYDLITDKIFTGTYQIGINRIILR
ncbi:MAG: deoxynucleoside kinase [Bacteroidales bacterium]|nr:deoxynucleoside kinase [Bacteroidales bacterium]